MATSGPFSVPVSPALGQQKTPHSGQVQFGGEELVGGPPELKEGAWVTPKPTAAEPCSVTSFQLWGWGWGWRGVPPTPLLPPTGSCVSAGALDVPLLPPPKLSAPP